MANKSIKYWASILGICLLICDELLYNSQTFLSIVGLLLLVVGLYLISRGIEDKPSIDPYAVQSYEEEE